MSTLILLALLSLHAEAATRTFPACTKAPEAQAAKLRARRAQLGAAIAAASPGPCGKDRPMPAVHAQVQAYSKAAHSVTAKLQKMKARAAAPCAREIDDYVNAAEADQRKLYEQVEALCR